ncbi:potassium transporter 5-like [Rhododendron vialii]|uniref:potassium transporter 5-like n=1 Tax=Rhododendron vialii TaxID=182163 RepID=UPI00265E4802|nr:potassium transporter 5-like [Rhododendron vialii]
MSTTGDSIVNDDDDLNPDHEDHIHDQEEVSHQQQQLEAKKISSQKLRRFDSLDIESSKFRSHQHLGDKGAKWSVILNLAFQSIGVVYGDLGTSPLYVYPATFSGGIKHNDDILGTLSLIFYTITLIPVVKYVFIVLRANDNGDGGTFALYSLICRYAKVGLIPSQEAEDREVSNYHLESPNNNRLRRASWVKSKLEKSLFAKYFLLFATMLGTSMVIGDGILTPCISVLSAVGGIKEATSSMTEDRIVWISVAILVVLFMVQRFGTDKVGYSFAPILCLWFLFIGTIGIYNFIKFDPTVIKAINPWYIVQYFKRNKKQAWISLGGTVLSITGTEALFGDLGHFSVRSIQISTCAVVYPSIILCYVGQSAVLRKHNEYSSDAFFKSVPGPVYWPMFVVAVLAAIIASQAMISATFSIIQQSLSLGCFPRVKVVHTSAKYEGQVYVPEINYLLMLACVAVTIGFRTTDRIGNAYGIAVVFVMVLTSSFLVLIMIMIWKTHILLIISYVLVIGTIELIYLSSVLYKFDQGGYLPLAFAMFLMAIMYVWNDVYRRKYNYELDHKISLQKVKEIVGNTNFYRIPGLAIFYSELVHGIPPLFKHYLDNVPALHSVLVFVSIKSLPISKVPREERFLFRRVQPNELNVFRCVVRYGYTDVRNEQDPFERKLVERLKNFISEEYQFSKTIQNNQESAEKDGELDDTLVEREIEVLEKACTAGIVHLVGENEVIAEKGAGIGKRLLINYGYSFLKRNLRQTDKVFDIPRKCLLKVGMTYEL